MNDDDAAGAEASALVAAVAAAYERGWQPADLLHVTRRGDESPPELAAAAVLYEARRSRAAERAPSDWTGQLDALAEQYPAQARLVGQLPADDPTGRQLAAALTAGRSGFFGYQFGELAAEWNRLPQWTFLTDPPSQWPAEGPATAARPATPTTPTTPSTAADPKMLNRIRGLLTKAERTEFTQEAETFTAKAQELMTRYAIDAALLRTRAHTGPANVRSRRVHLDNPYVTEKVHLLTAIGEANRVRTVWFGDLSIAVAVGTPVDLQQVDLLFTSLLVQANHTLQSTAGQGRSGARTTAFRKAFLAGFASRVGQRLGEADARATEAAAADESMPVADLLPILATTSAAVEAEFNRLFPGTRRSRSRSVDAGGWHAGRAAADDASLTPGAGRINRK